MNGNRESTICARFSHCKSLQKLQPNRSEELSAGLAATYPPVVDADEWPSVHRSLMAQVADQSQVHRQWLTQWLASTATETASFRNDGYY